MHPDLQAQQSSTPGNDGETEPASLCLIPFLVFELLEFLEYLISLVRRNADAGIPDFNPHLALPPPASDQYPAVLCVADGVSDQVPNNALEQHGVGMADHA